jgi:hypothetical protein
MLGFEKTHQRSAFRDPRMPHVAQTSERGEGQTDRNPKMGILISRNIIL